MLKLFEYCGILYISKRAMEQTPLELERTNKHEEVQQDHCGRFALL